MQTVPCGDAESSRNATEEFWMQRYGSVPSAGLQTPSPRPDRPSLKFRKLQEPPASPILVAEVSQEGIQCLKGLLDATETETRTKDTTRTTTDKDTTTTTAETTTQDTIRTAETSAQDTTETLHVMCPKARDQLLERLRRKRTEAETRRTKDTTTTTAETTTQDTTRTAETSAQDSTDQLLERLRRKRTETETTDKDLDKDAILKALAMREYLECDRATAETTTEEGHAAVDPYNEKLSLTKQDLYHMIE